MELTTVDRLLICLVEQPRNVAMAMRTAGYTQEQISEAWREARSSKFTESTGLGQYRLTESGRMSGKDLIEQFIR